MTGIDPCVASQWLPGCVDSHPCCIIVVTTARQLGSHLVPWRGPAVGRRRAHHCLEEPSDEINFSSIRGLAKGRAAGAQLGDLHGLQPDQRRAARGRAAPGHTHKNGASRADCALPPLQKKPLTSRNDRDCDAAPRFRKTADETAATASREDAHTPPDPDLQLLPCRLRRSFSLAFRPAIEPCSHHC